MRRTIAAGCVRKNADSRYRRMCLEHSTIASINGGTKCNRNSVYVDTNLWIGHWSLLGFSVRDRNTKGWLASLGWVLNVDLLIFGWIVVVP
jgi:hypothetical protein